VLIDILTTAVISAKNSRRDPGMYELYIHMNVCTSLVEKFSQKVYKKQLESKNLEEPSNALQNVLYI
jgi:hypothetical protein